MINYEKLIFLVFSAKTNQNQIFFKMKSIFCPISSKRIEENTVRLTGFFMVVMLILSVWFKVKILLVIVILDYFLRAFTDLAHSPLSWTARQTVEYFQWPLKPIDKAPKIFAARAGFLLALVGSSLTMLMPWVGELLLMLLGVFAFLESVGNICVGCLIYTHVVLNIYK